MSKRLWPYDLSNARDFPTKCLTNTRLDCVSTEVNKHGDWTTGILTLLLLRGLVFDCCLLLQGFMVSNPRALILFLHSPKLIWTYQSTWNFLLVSIPLTFHMVTSVTTSSNSTKVSTVSNRLAITGSTNYAKDSLLAISFKVTLINASSFKRIASFSFVSTIALYLEKIWQLLMQLFPP